MYQCNKQGRTVKSRIDVVFPGDDENDPSTGQIDVKYRIIPRKEAKLLMRDYEALVRRTVVELGPVSDADGNSVSGTAAIDAVCDDEFALPAVALGYIRVSQELQLKNFGKPPVIGRQH